jgi:hypothetical protein
MSWSKLQAWDADRVATLNRKQLAVAIGRSNDIAMQTSRSLNTQSTYDSAYAKWKFFCLKFGHEPTCEGQQVSDLIDRICAFIGFQCGLLGIQAKSIRSVYLPGIASTLTRRMLRSGELFQKAYQSPVIQVLLDGYQRPHDMMHPASSKVKLPFLLEMALKGRLLVQQGLLLIQCRRCTMDDSRRDQLIAWRIHVALVTGIFFLLRKSEFLENTSRKGVTRRSLTRQDLKFYDEEKRELSYGEIGKVKASSVRLVVQFSKMDQSGFGRILHHYRQRGSKHQVCIVTELETWIHQTRDTQGTDVGTPLFHCTGLPLLSTAQLASHMRQICLKLGLPASRVSPHSLRYGGATMLAAKGFPRYVIEQMGGWAPGSSALNRYIQATNMTRIEVSSAMANGIRDQATQSLESFLEDFSRERKANLILHGDQNGEVVEKNEVETFSQWNHGKGYRRRNDSR